MKLFSQRKGIKPVSKEFQREAVDEELRNRLWSAIKVIVWDNWRPASYYDGYNASSQVVNGLLDRIWLNYYKLPLDVRPPLFVDNSSNGGAYGVLRKYFFSANWNEIYDLIEFIIKNIPEKWKKELRDFCNSLLEDENAAYRILEQEVVEITDETEIKAIEEALQVKNQPIQTHLSRALELLSDRKNPDYRNSIKESVSAVEACCQYIADNPKATLGDALKKINSVGGAHPALEKGFLAIYGYTSDSGGIRHALVDEDQTPSYADAKFMLVACSGFVNYLLTKATENGTKSRKK